MSFHRSDQQTIEDWIDNGFELVFKQLKSSDLTLQIAGLGQFEVMYHFCRNFNYDSKYLKTKIFRKAFNMLPTMRHLFETKVSEQTQKELEEFSKMENFEYY